MLTKEEVNYRAFNKFAEQLEYKYPMNKSIEEYLSDNIDMIIQVKDEILSNIAILEPSKFHAYFNQLHFKLTLLKQLNNITKQQLNTCLEKFNVPFEKMFDPTALGGSDKLLKLLTTKTANNEKDTPNSLETYSIQEKFYGFFYQEAIQKVIDFIDEQKELYILEDEKSILCAEEDKKINVNLSSEELAYLFRLFIAEGAVTLEYNQQENFCQAVADTFTLTEGKLDARSFKNNLTNHKPKPEVFNKVAELLTNIKNKVLKDVTNTD